MESYANAILSAFEDPEKILEQSVLEMNNDLTKMRQATAQVLASQKQLENKYRAAQQGTEEYNLPLGRERRTLHVKLLNGEKLML
ncbi:membrane-associated 30 kDa protein, chloroplastic-like isoform X3 [Actinidia eriantha]|uniref:membrane-associated 30 kDa protein, chloroplastic-like isoform X3 n=1 Tax=Actinidia eriantha TaxID=165200 RepID=UPI00258DCCDF|nr:membrane-associated 30 kDa protein, chloroplastic-like isoform X3 [Actinidia eriantha]